MLQKLYIKNLAVIDNLEVEFESGLNVLTGETGAGKSIIIDAISALMGNRISPDLVRSGERTAVIEADFKLDMDCLHQLQTELSSQSVDILSDEIIIRREINSSGRSRIFLDDQKVSLAFIKTIAPRLVELHMQGEQQSLSSGRAQMNLLDVYAQCFMLRDKVEAAFIERQRLINEIEAVRNTARETGLARDYLQFKLNEIESVNPSLGEDAELEIERSKLVNAEKIVELQQLIYEKLYEDDDSLLSRLNSLKRHLLDLSVLDNSVAPSLEVFGSASLTLTDIAENLRRNNVCDYSPERLNSIENRLVELQKLKRKYGGTLEETLSTKTSIVEKLKQLDLSVETETHLVALLRDVEQKYLALAANLSEIRHNAARDLSNLVTAELPHVALAGAVFNIEVSSSTVDFVVEAQSTDVAVQNKSWSAYGVDRVHFYFNANIGEENRLLTQVASGGELSRLLLVLREVCRSNLSRETFIGDAIIFDEIDTGISGRIAETIGLKLSILAKGQQVLCITHQPQIARFADAHFLVSKIEKDGRTRSHINKLNYDQRVREIAGLMAADEELPTALQTAEWLLKTALEAKSETKPTKLSVSKKRRKRYEKSPKDNVLV